MTCLCTRKCLLGVAMSLLVICSWLPGANPPKPPFWWRELALLSQTRYILGLKLAYYRNYWSIPTIFRTVINTSKYSSWVDQTRTKQTQDGERPLFWKKSKNRRISATAWPIATKFGRVTHIGPLHATHSHSQSHWTERDAACRTQ